MKRDILQNQYKSKGLFGTLIADIICFLVVIALSVGFCYSYFSDKVNVMGNATTATIAIAYQDGAGAKLTNITGKINGATATNLNGGRIAPGDTIDFAGTVVSIGDDGTSASATANAYVLAKLEVINLDTADIAGKSDEYIQEHTIDKETIWYNITNGEIVYVERGIFQVGASLLTAKSSQQLNLSYTFEGDKYDSNYLGIKLILTLHAHQQAFLDLADDYSNYSAVGAYTKESVYATHCITGRKRDVWTSDDANVTGKTLSDLQTDESGAYLINTCNDWMIVRAASTSANAYHEGKIFKLNAYLDFNNDTTNKTIGQLNGIFDGQGYTISNWTGEQGLITTGYGDISNLGVDGIRLTNVNNAVISGYAIGGIVGQLHTSSIENCFVVGLGQYISGIDYDFNLNTSVQCLGGIVGNVRGDSSANVTAIIKNCYAVLSIYKIYETAKVSCVGGIYGEVYPTTASIDNCYFKGTITNVNEAAKYNGLIGGNLNGRGTVNNCFGIAPSEISNTGTTKIVALQNSDVNNCAYIINSSISDDTIATKVGLNQTDIQLNYAKLSSVGVLRDAFGWDTNTWATDIYTGDSGLLVLRVFYNF